MIWASVLIVAMAVGYLTYRVSLDRVGAATRRALEEARAAAAKAAVTVEKVAEKFQRGTITQTFRAEIPVLQSAGVGRLEVGSIEATETFRKTDSRKMMWDWIDMGETVSEIKVPVTYRYHVDLGGDWRIDVQGHSCVVYAPALVPTLPPAIDTQKMEKYSRNGWARFNERALLESLESSITPTISTYACAKTRKDGVREHARLTVARFIRAWLLREEQWGNERLSSVVVIFADEEAGGGVRVPTLEFGKD